jgi:hypothetical protein
LPQAGESLGQSAFDLFFDRFLFFVLIGFTLLWVGVTEWFGIWMGSPITPWFWTISGIGLLLLAVWRGMRIKPQLEQIFQGRRGERETGRLLERLRADDYEVFHDIPGDRFNVDHVLIGPGGVFAVETKTISKPNDHDAQIDYDGQRVLVDGFAPDRDPIKQVQASAAHIADILHRKTGRTVPVRPVLLYPGWYVNGKTREAATWVLNSNAFLKWIRNEPACLPREDVALYSNALEIHLSAD